MQFLCGIAIAASLSLRAESNDLHPPDKTVIHEPLPDETMQVEANIAEREQRVHENIVAMEHCDDTVDCTPIVVENCEKLWEEKLKVCVEKAEEWAYMCSAPKYTAYDGHQHNCAYGCCSEVGQEVQEGCGEEMPEPEEIWEYMSGDDDEITRPELEGGLTVMLPPVFGDHVGDLTECMMEGYDVSKDGKIDETEFMDSFGKILPGCMEKHVPAELLARMAAHKNCGEEEEETLDAIFHEVSGGDGEIHPEDVAVVLSEEMPPQFAHHAMPLAECIVGLVDTGKDGAVQFEEFKVAAEQEMDIMTPCMMKSIPEEELANAAAHNNEHWCHYTDPEEEPCCKLESHEEQDECMAEKTADAHYCDFTGPDYEGCCAETSREEQDACLEHKHGHFLGQKKRKPHLLNKDVPAAFARFFRSKTVKSLKKKSFKVVKL
jgi:hypothetical protein